MSAEIVIPPIPTEWIDSRERAAWRAGYLAGMDAGLAQAEAIVKGLSDAEDAATATTEVPK